MNDERRTIRLVDPLPCAIRTDDGLCGKPATVAHAWLLHQAADRSLTRYYTPGLWQLQPVCESCALAAAKVYGVTR